MTKSRFSTFRVGVLIAVGIGLFCFSIFYIGYGSRFLQRTGLVQARFRRTSGLLAGAPVALNGVNVGAVSSIRFPEDPDADYVIVRMWVEQRALDRIRSDAAANIRTMGLLGDKYVEITGGTSRAPRLDPGGMLPTQEPIDYEAIFQQPNARDFIANMTAVSGQLRSLLESLNSHQSILGEVINGDPATREQRLTLSDIRKGFGDITHLATDLDRTMRKMNNDQSLFGATLSSKGPGRKLLANLDSAARSMQAAADSAKVAADSLNNFALRYGEGQGAMSRLFTDREFGDQILANLHDSSADLRDILRKINHGQGSLGMAVNDPKLYNNANSFLGGGWGIRLLNSIYGVTHPLAKTDSDQIPPANGVAEAEKPQQISASPPPSLNLSPPRQPSSVKNDP